jgi:hypothetical protein
MKVDTQRRHSTAPGEIADAVSPLVSSTQISPDENGSNLTSPPPGASIITTYKTFQAEQTRTDVDIMPTASFANRHFPATSTIEVIILSQAVSFASLTNPIHLLKWFQRSLLLDEKRAIRLYVPDCPFYFRRLLSKPVNSLQTET